MDVVVWIVSGLLALAFLMAGGMKLMQPKSKLAENMGWVEDFSESQVKGIGALEVAGALGLILPEALTIVPILTPLAAVGLVLTMIGAARTHLRRGETNMLMPNVILGILALFVALARFGVF